MKLYNTLSRNIEKIEPGNGNRITMYSCGLTVYSQPHIGNWVAYIYIDVLFRVLTAAGYEVDRVQNITDVGHLVSDDDAGEDKMEKGARNEGITAWDVAEKYITVADHEGYELLGLLKPAKLIRATELISEQIEFIKQLQEQELKLKAKEIRQILRFGNSRQKINNATWNGTVLGARVFQAGI